MEMELSDILCSLENVTHVLLQGPCMCPSVPSLSCPALCSPPGPSVHRTSQAKNTGLGCPSLLLQGNFQTQGWNLDLLNWQAGSWPLSQQRNLHLHVFPAHAEWGISTCPQPRLSPARFSLTAPGAYGRGDDLAQAGPLWTCLRKSWAAGTLEVERARFKCMPRFLWVCFLNWKIRLTANLNSKCCKVDKMR